MIECVHLFLLPSPSKFVHHPPFCSSQPLFSADQKAYHSETKPPFPTRTIFWAILNRPFFLFFCHRGFLRPERPLFEGKPQREYLFSVSHTSSVSSLFASRDASTSTIRTYTRTQHNTYKMFSMTQSASFCATQSKCCRAKKATIQNQEIFHPSQSDHQLGIFIQERLPLRRGVVLRVPLRRRRQRGDEESEKDFILLRCCGEKVSGPPRKSPPRNPRTSRKGKPSSRRRPSRRRLRRDEAEEVCQSPGNPPLFPRVREKPDRRRKRERASINKFNDTLHMKDDEMRSQKERERESARFPL